MANKKPKDRQEPRLEKVVREAGELDIRRQKQIANQRDSIDRLLVDGRYDAEMAQLHQQLAEAQASLEEALERIRELED